MSMKISQALKVLDDKKKYDERKDNVLFNTVPASQPVESSLDTSWDAYKQKEEKPSIPETGKQEEQKEEQPSWWEALVQNLSGSTAALTIATGENPKDYSQKDYDEAQSRIAKDNALMEQSLKEISALPAEDKKSLNDYFVLQSRMKAGDMPSVQEMEAAGVNELTKKYGSKLNVWMETMQRSQNKQTVEDAQKAGKRDSGFWGTVGSVAANAIAAPSSALDAATQYMQKGINRLAGVDSYETIDPNSGKRYGAWSSGVREQTKENIQKSLGGGFAGTAAGVVYDGVVSVLDSAVQALIGGGVANAAGFANASVPVFKSGERLASLAGAGMGAFGNATSEAAERGASTGGALANALVEAGAEMGTELLPLDRLMSALKGGNTKFTKLIADGVKNIFPEIGGELLNNIIKNTSQRMFLRGAAEYNTMIGDAIAKGATEQEAQQMAAEAALSEFAQTVAVSVVSSVSGPAIYSGAGRAAGLWNQQTQQAQTAQPVQQTQQQSTDPVDIVADQLRKNQQEAAQHEAQQAAQTAQNQQTEQVTAQQQTQPQQPQMAQNQAVASALDTMEQTGKPTNSQVEAIVNDPAALEELGIDPHATKAERRTAVRDSLSEILNPQQKAQTQPVQDNVQNQPEMVQPSEENSQSDVEMESATQSASEQESLQGQETQGEQSKPFDPEAWRKNQERDGIQRDRINSVRDQEIPNYDDSGKKNSEFAGNAFTSSETSDRNAQAIRDAVQKGRASYTPVSNSDQLDSATQYVTEKGIDRTLNECREVADNKMTGEEYIARMEVVYSYLAENGNDAQLEDAFEVLAHLATNTGRSLQLYSYFRKLSPESQTRAAVSDVNKAIGDAAKRGKVKNASDIQVSQDLQDEYTEAAREYQTAKSQKARQEAENKMADIQSRMYREAVSKMKATFKAKWDAWRYMCMMGNVKTNARNVFGNALYRPYQQVSNAVGVAFERAFVAKDQRTKSVVGFMGDDLALRQWAAADAKTDAARELLGKDTKRGDIAKSRAEEDMRIFDNGLLEKFRKLTEWAPEAEDMVFKSWEYTSSLAGFLKARGYTAQQIQSGTVSDTVLNEARAYAAEQALRATFNDSNAVSDFIASIGRGKDWQDMNGFEKTMNSLAEGVMPFRRTPANILVRGFENSPGGLIKAAYQCEEAVRTGKYSASTVIDSLAHGLTGTAAMALGGALAKGIGGIRLRGTVDDDDEKRRGFQSYALEVTVGGETYSYTIDWAAPSNLPLFVGANIVQLMEQNGEPAVGTAEFVQSIADAGMYALEPMLELSCLSSMNDLISAGKYSDAPGYALLTTAATSYLMQGIPSLAKQADRAAKQNKSMAFSDSESSFVRGIERTAAQLPFVGRYLQTDVIDPWGRHVDEAGALESFVSPGNKKKIDNSPLEKEIERLGQNGVNVSPAEVPRKISWAGQPERMMTEGEYTKMRETVGAMRFDILTELTDSAAYNAMSDEQKESIFDAAYKYALEYGKTQTFSDYPGLRETWMEDIDASDPSDGIMLHAMGSEINKAISDMRSAFKSGDSAETAGNNLKSIFDAAEKAGVLKDLSESIGGAGKNYIEAIQGGHTTEEFANVYKKYYEIDNTEGLTAHERFEQFSATLDKQVELKGLSADSAAYYKKMFKFYSAPPVATAKQYEEMKTRGTSTDVSYYLAQEIDKANSAAKAKGKDKASTGELYTAIANADASEIDMLNAIYSVTDDFNPSAKTIDTTELKIQYMNEVLDKSPKDIADIYVIWGNPDLTDKQKKERLGTTIYNILKKGKETVMSYYGY